jgi:hypothetical protein
MMKKVREALLHQSLSQDQIQDLILQMATKIEDLESRLEEIGSASTKVERPTGRIDLI